jgi:O-methyltransferase
VVSVSDEWFRRLLYFDRLLEGIHGVEGAVVECGVAAGQSLAMLASLLRAREEARHIWGFDSWAGLPEPTREDLTSADSLAATGMFAWATKGQVIDELRAHGFSPSEIERTVTLVRGELGNTLPLYEGGPIALVHIDVDLYDSYRKVLTHLWPKLGRGGIAAFDEYGSALTWPGARQAVDDFLSTLDPESFELVRDAQSSKWFVVKRG